MKSQLSVSFKIIILLLVSAFWSGCAQDAKESGQNQPAPIPAVRPATNVVAGTETNQVEAAPITKIAATPVATSPAAGEVIKLTEAGVAESVVLGYISNSTTAYNLSVEEILYLYDIGISSQVITAMMRHDTELREKPGETSELEAQISNQQTNIMAELAGIKETLAQETPAPAAPAQQPTGPSEAPTPAPATAQAAPETAQQPVYANLPAQVNSFYTDLSPYGSWYELPGYGWCWQPRVVVVNPYWQPYCDRGNWLWTDCGWYWRSDYSWGWAPFHYGRWHHHGSVGWVWFPDSCWAPAWVSWRYTDSHCGWAPLPPSAHFSAGVGWTDHGTHVGLSFSFGLAASHYTFVDWGHFHGHNPRRYALAPTQAGNVYRNSTVINNYVVGNNNTIINEGVGLKRAAAATQGEIRKVEVRDLPANASHYVKPDRLERSGSSMVVYRAPLSEPGKPAATPASSPGRASTSLGGHALPGPTLTPINKRSEERPSLAATRTSYQPQVKPESLRPLSSTPTAGRYTSGTTAPDPRPAANPALKSLTPHNEEPKRATTLSPSVAQPTAATPRYASPTALKPRSVGTVSTAAPQWQRPASPVILKPSDSHAVARSTTPTPTYSAPKSPVIIRSTSRSEVQSGVSAPRYRSDLPRTTVPSPTYQSPGRSYTPSFSSPARSYTPNPSPSIAPSRPTYSAPTPSYSAPAPRSTPQISSGPAPSSAPSRSSPTPSPSASRPSLRER